MSDNTVLDVTKTTASPVSTPSMTFIQGGKTEVLDKAHKQWATRPNDQRYSRLEALIAAVKARHDISKQGVVHTKDIRAVVDPTTGLMLKGPSGKQVTFTNWSFDQLCRLTKAPAGYLPTLPDDLAAKCLNHGLLESDRELKALVSVENGSEIGVLRSMNSPKYARVWDDQALNWISDLTEGGGWKLPVAYKDGKWGAELVPSGAYASDRDCFLFMVDETRPIVVKDRKLSRGFFFWNSEVGAQTIGMDMFLYDHVCGNHYVWGATVIAELRRRHIGEMLETNAFKDMKNLLVHYTNTSLEKEEAIIRKAHDMKIVDKPVPFLRTKGFAKFEAEEGVKAAQKEEGNAETLWSLVQGLTAYARTLPNRDARADLDRRAGKLIDLAA